MSAQPRLNHRQRYMAMLEAAGATPKEIARELKLSSGRVSQIRHSPLYHVQVSQIQKEMIRTSAATVIERIMGDAVENVEFLKKVRDGDYATEEMEHLRARMDASKTLFDRQAPKRTQEESIRTVHITVEKEERVSIDAVCEEINEPIMIEDQRDDTSVEPVVHDEIRPREIDDVIEEYAAQEYERG